jgi:hypothetical protein
MIDQRYRTMSLNKSVASFYMITIHVQPGIHRISVIETRVLSSLLVRKHYVSTIRCLNSHASVHHLTDKQLQLAEFAFLNILHIVTTDFLTMLSDQ